MKHKAIVVFAPTAAGKTALVTKTFGQGGLFDFKAEVVSADSQAVYKYCNIGTAKPTQEECRLIPHHIIDVSEPDKQFGLYEWFLEADKISHWLNQQGKIPVICGGTGFYVRNFILGLPKAPECSPELRQQIQQRMKTQGKEALFAELELYDPEYAKKININDEYRICRALEVFYTSGKPLSSYKTPDVPRSDFDFCTIILNRTKDDLYSRIDLRIEKMFELGLAEEIECLKKMGLGKESPCMKAIGYSEFFDSELKNLDQIKEKIKLDSHHYAKKQYTFMRGIPGAVTVDADDIDTFSDVIKKFLIQS